MSLNNIDLDLSKVSNEDVEELASKINTFYLGESSTKSQLAWHWERAQMMLDGNQWLVYDGNRGTGGQWNRLQVSDNNNYIPRPVTNYMYSIYQTLKSYLIKNKPRSTVHPNTQDYKDKSACKIANLCLEANWTRLKEQYNYETAASVILTYGTVFKKSYWDTSSLSMVKVPRMRTEPILDPMTGQQTGETEVQDTDPITHDPLFDELPLGDVNTYILEPYRMTLDPLAMHLHDARWVMEYTIQPLEWIRETFDKEGDGYTGLASLVEEEKALNGSLQRWFKLRTSSGMRNEVARGLVSSGTAETYLQNSAIVKEYYERPTANYPKGRMIVVAGDKCVYAGESPYQGPEQGDWHPYSECRWELVPGRFWGKSPLDDAAEIQKRINTIDSTVILTRKTSAIPQKLIPHSAGIAPGSWTGRSGQLIYFRDGGGAKPEILPSSGVDQSVFAERAQCVSDLKEITGAIDILKGDRPPGVNAASALNLLYEVGTGKLYPILERWKMFVEQDQKKQLRLIAQKYKEPRPEWIRLLKSKNSELSEEDINQFIGADLNDNWNVVVEAGSNIPKLQAAKQGMLVELAQMGMLNLQDPGNRVQFQQDMGIAGYDADIEPDRKRAEWENDILDNIQYTPDNRAIVLVIDNHQEHLSVHQTRMKSPNFMALPLAVQQAYMRHIKEHEQYQAQALHAQMLQQQAMTPVGAPQAAPKGQASQPAGIQGGHGKGLTKDMKSAVMGGSDVLTPAALGGGA